MVLLIVFLICLFIAIGTGVLAAWSDFKGLTIENVHTLVVIGSFVAAYAVLWLGGRDDVFAPLLSHVLGALVVFIMTLAMFALRGIGAADSKLGTAYALWVGLGGVVPYLFYTTLFGGLLGVIALALRRWKPVQNPPDGSWIARVQGGESKVPYGIAIVLGAVASFINLGYIGSEVLSSFLLS